MESISDENVDIITKVDNYYGEITQSQHKISVHTVKYPRKLLL